MSTVSPLLPLLIVLDGYAPNLGANAFFTAFFFLSCVVFIIQAIRYRNWWGFTIATTLGTALEGVGYVSRIMLHSDPFSDVGFKLNIVCLTFAPAFLSAGIYLLLKHLCLTFGPQFSRLRPQLYTYIFISCDLLSIILQGAGGALSASAADGSNLLNIGVDVMIAGLSSQVVTLAIFAALAADFFCGVWRHKHELPVATAPLRNSTRFKLFLAFTVVAFLCIFIRCCYRIAELSGGWGNPIMRKEAEFIVLDSVMIMIAALVFNIFHPGLCFDRSNDSLAAPKEKSAGGSEFEMVDSYSAKPNNIV
ncbi:hypothetical protein MBLNU459_g6199t1 [Dothideomycetes sp. NU459]